MKFQIKFCVHKSKAFLPFECSRGEASRTLLAPAAIYFLNYSRLASLIRWEKTDYLSAELNCHKVDDEGQIAIRKRKHCKLNLLRLVEFIRDESNNDGNDEDDWETGGLACGIRIGRYVAPELCC